MNQLSTTAVTTARAPRTLRLVPAVRRSDAQDRKLAIRRVLEARDTIKARSERFAYLKRVYD